MSTSTGTRHTNAAGLTPDESKSLTERPIQPHEQPIIAGLVEMYSCQPSKTTFDIYTNDAVFHDPIGIAQGVDSIQNQFVGLAKIFPRAEIPKFRVLQNPATVPSTTIIIDQDVAYFRDPSSKSPTKTINSLLTLRLDSATNKIASHTEEWNHQRTSDGEDGYMGWLNEQRKKITANIVDAFVGKGSSTQN
ncbi:hypothetical protein FA15DRAFT_673957 [Coprinopsis marcescibilis]|uniref:SnoaL-like domain-containing protein n=1 Tax=Coprinopsis marcescibilis TaxID=230819 RepID=A0A5C3KIQ3_COPMA|nr:hypothetical protein FA15DRAFT_673957 [Coprinopsis marcescibilis]